MSAGEVSSELFSVLGVRPALGRWFLPEEDRPGGERTVVLGAALWHRRFGGDARVLGRRITLGGASYAVVGVAPADLDFPAASDLWVPLALDLSKERRGAHYLGVIGRLAPGVELRGARLEMAAIAAALGRQFPADDAYWGVVLRGLRDLLVEDVRPALVALQVAVWMILAIGCVNVGNLLLARMSSRRREIALRSALGAGRWRLVRQIGAEGLLVACGGGALGLLVAAWGAPALVALYPGFLPHAETIGLHAPVLGYALLLSLATGVACGALPALAATGGPLAPILQGGGRALSGTRRSHPLRRLLVPAQVALALTLLAGAGLLVRSFARLQEVHLGFDARGTTTGQLSLPAARYPDGVHQAELYRRVLQEVRAVPGVEHAAAVDALPLASGGQVAEVAAEGRRIDVPGESFAGRGSQVSPDYFRAMGIPLLEGRSFTDSDGLASPPVVVVSRLAARRLWPGQDPIGRRITFGKLPTHPDAEWWTVIGVAGDVRASDPAAAPEIEAYISQFQIASARATLVVHAAGDPRRLTAALRRAVHRIDPDLPLDRVQVFADVVAASFGTPRIQTLLLFLFAALAVGLAPPATGRRPAMAGDAAASSWSWRAASTCNEQRPWSSPVRHLRP